MLKNENLFTFLLIFIMIILFFCFIGSFKNTYIQKELINANLITIEKIIENKDIPKNYDKNIFVLLDNFSDLNFEYNNGFGRTISHGYRVLEEFNKIKDNDYKIILINNSLINYKNEKLKLFFLYNQNIVSFIKDVKNYYYEDVLDKIIKDNPNANIIINQSFFNNSYFNNNVNLLNKYNNINIIQSLPYKGNNLNQDVIELHGKLFNYNHNRLLYITKCGDYLPSFSNNIKCSNENTSLSAPKLGYEYFKK